MNSNIAYSSSLKRMIGFKIFPNINPEQIKTSIKNSVTDNRYSQMAPKARAEKRIQKLKTEIQEYQLKQHAIDRQVDRIMNKIADEGLVKVTNQKIRKSGRTHIRIVTQGNQRSPNKQDINTQGQVQSILKLPNISRSNSANQVHSFRLKTEARLFQKNDTYQQIDAQKYIKHYRAGMSSLSKIKNKHAY